MSEPTQSTPIGIEMNGFVWDGTHWVPKTDGSGHVFDGRSWKPASGQGGHQPPLRAMLPQLAGGEAFVDPHYSYRLTRQTSDDLQFIVRVHKIAIIVALIMLIPALIFMVMGIASAFAALASLGSIVAQRPR